jgi:L-alanine-DL-glutamate epimerase-like enolase superfamily enzyme
MSGRQFPPKRTDVYIEDVSYGYEDFRYRTPIKFGGVPLDRTTILNVHCGVRTVAGTPARGFGSMPLGNVWSFPSRRLSFDTTLSAMKTLAERVADIFRGCDEPGHPIDLTCKMEPAFLKAALEVAQQMQLEEPIPALCTLVTASPFDAALHDAFGKAHRLNCYRTYGPEFMTHDLGHYLGPQFEGEWLESYLSKEPKPSLPLYHLIGALDPLEPEDVRDPSQDGLPETLGEWLRTDGVTHLKIKLNGDDVSWDLERVLRVDRVVAQVRQELGIEQWSYSTDFNERCPNVDYLLEFLRQLQERNPAAFDRIEYIEQPTARDLRADRGNVMHEASRLRPVVIDESLIDLESLLLAREMGYTGVALKACKGQTQSLLMAAAAQKFGMFLCVQDLTCPGASLIQSAGLAAHVPPVAAIEANARQYVPAANKPWEQKFPGIFQITNGTMQTDALRGVGLSAVEV